MFYGSLELSQAGKADPEESQRINLPINKDGKQPGFCSLDEPRAMVVSGQLLADD